MNPQWFEVDRGGLSKLMARRGKGFIVAELIQNAWDEAGVTSVTVTLERTPGDRQVVLEVVDDSPNGFEDLTQAFTLFATSRKLTDPTARGRFCLGEKLSLAMATEARIISTTGGWVFGEKGRTKTRERRERGTSVQLRLPMTREEVDACGDLVRRLLPPPHIRTTFNGEQLAARAIAFSTEQSLTTEIADAEGGLRPTKRRTRIDILRTQEGEEGWLFEMGIPVVATGDRYHVDVAQKVPLNMERDNVPPAFLRAIRTITLNLVHAEIDPESANATWAREALSDPNVTADAVTSAFRARFGEKAVVYDPTDAEANKIAVARGYVVVHGGQMNSAEWGNVRRAGVVLPAGQVTPSPKPYSENGDQLRVVAPEKWTPSMMAFAAFSGALAEQVLAGAHIEVTYVIDPQWRFSATYGPGHLTLNLGVLGKGFPEQGITERAVALLIHEFGHHYSGDHLSSKYHDALTDIGARLALAAARIPDLLRFERYLPARPPA